MRLMIRCSERAYDSSSNNPPFRLSSSSTLPSLEAPGTSSSSTSDFHKRHHEESLFHHRFSSPFSKKNDPKSNSTTHITMQAPTLETPIESGSMFGDDMFGLGKSNRFSNVEPTAAKQSSQSVSPLPVRSGSPDSYDSANFRDDGERISVKQVNRKQATQGNPTITMRQSQSPASYSPGLESPALDKSWGRRQSEEGLMAYDNSPRGSRSLTPQVQTFSQAHQTHGRQDSLTAPVPHHYGRKRNSGDNTTTVRRSSALMRRTSMEDEDAKIVRNSVRRIDTATYERSNVQQQHLSTSSTASSKLVDPDKKDRDSGWEENIASSGNSSVHSLPGAKVQLPQQQQQQQPKKVTPQPMPSPSTEDDNVFDLTITESVSLAVSYERREELRARSPAAPKKMTKAEYEKYLKQKEAESAKSDSSDESEVESEDDDSEHERWKQAQLQREKQEAHLAVHRQQLMKETGVPAAPNFNRATTAPTLSLSGANISGNVSDEEDDIPLAILQAHGFPNKNRPPTRLSNLSTPSLGNIRASQNLPVFARNLPADPYANGNGLVNSATRMSLGFGVGADNRLAMGGGGSVYGGGGGSVYGGGGSVYGGGGGSVYGGSNVSLYAQMEMVEAQKAARRPNNGKISPYRTGSPALPGQDKVPTTGVGLLGLGGGSGGMGMDPRMSMMPPPQQMGMGMGMGMGGMDPRMSMLPPQQPMMGMGGMGMDPRMSMLPPLTAPAAPGASQTQQLEMQMEMLRLQIELAKMQQQNASTPSLPPPTRDSLAPPPSQQSFRPQLQPQQRAMSMINPTFPPPNRPMSTFAPSIAPNQQAYPPINFPPPGTYTASIAPSERSTVGQPRRYRGVSNTNGSQSGRTSTLLSQAPPQIKVPPTSGLRKVSAGSDDEDDWAEEKRKREEKKKGWRGKKQSVLGGLLSS